MQFDVVILRNEGVARPKHVWTQLRGEFYVGEERDAELGRTVRRAELREPGTTGKVLLGPLMDVMIVSAKPDFWTVTGWERVPNMYPDKARAVQQSWLMIPADVADADAAESSRRTALAEQSPLR